MILKVLKTFDFINVHKTFETNTNYHENLNKSFVFLLKIFVTPLLKTFISSFSPFALHSRYGIFNWRLNSCAFSIDTWNSNEKKLQSKLRRFQNNYSFSYHTLSLKIRFISHHQHRKFITIFDAKNLSMKLENFFKTSVICDTED